jgi:hypothetical protein
MSEARTKAEIGKASRSKGKRGELLLVNELKDLLGVDVKRRVRNFANDSDIVGLDGWSAEVKNCATPAMNAWWKQTVEQAKEGETPVLFYKLPRKPFKAVVPLELFIGGANSGLPYTMELSLEGFAAVYREKEALK